MKEIWAIRGIMIMGAMFCSAAGNAQSFTAKDSLKVKPNSALQFAPVPPVSFQKNNLPPASFSSSYINPGFFCRQEVKLDKKLPVPLRFRLGSMQYCNWLEQKPGYKGPQQ